ncbi:MAG: penicillin acylase family protein [Comamonas sp.]
MPRHLPDPARISLLALAALLAACSTTGPGNAPSSQASVPGLAQPAELLIDRWGVPHIYAANTYDAFVAQGYAAARDRLWQMDLWRKRGLGQMAQDFGPAWADSDRAARSVLFRGDMYREWLAYGSDAKRVAEAFVAGVNAFVAETERDPSRLPMEFRLMGYQPARWAAEDPVRIRHHGLTLNFSGEVDRAAAFCKGPDGVRADALRRETVPDTTAQVPEGLKPCAIDGAPLKRAYSLATAAPRFTRENTKVAVLPSPDALENAQLPDAHTLSSYGSNNWTIAPSLTDTGRPILANDPHRSHGAPSLRYISHLSAPGMDVIGAGEPFLPGISIGHNGKIAFGLTRFYMDQEDLYVYELNPANPHEYRYQGRWEPMVRVVEKIAVKGEARPREVENWYTRHGPVLHSDGKATAYALRAAWLDLGMAPYFGSMDYMRAQNWDQFRAAMNRWGAPGENQVYADAAGNIGWIPGGLTPIRPNWDGLLPVPGDGRFEWTGYRNGDELPWEFNPARGYVVTANENNVPPQHPLFRHGIGYEWSDPARAQRLHGVFEAQVASGKRFTLQDSERMQNDTMAVPAQRLLALLRPLQGQGNAAAALALLKGWDGNMAADSAAAALFNVWLMESLHPAVAATLPEAVRPVVKTEFSIERLVGWLEQPERHGMAPAQRDALLLASLSTGWDATAKRLGADAAKWQWGTVHQALFNHPLAAVADEATRQKLNVNAGPMGGSPSTPMAASYNANYQLTAGASFRMVVDVGNWDATRVVNTPGQSGDPASPHYRDLAPLWVKGEYFPLAYSRAAVERVATEHIRLEPAK